MLACISNLRGGGRGGGAGGGSVILVSQGYSVGDEGLVGDGCLVGDGDLYDLGEERSVCWRMVSIWWRLGGPGIAAFIHFVRTLVCNFAGTSARKSSLLILPSSHQLGASPRPDVEPRRSDDSPRRSDDAPRRLSFPVRGTRCESLPKLTDA